MSWRRIYFCFQKMPIHVWKNPKCISFILRTKALPICPYLCTDIIVLLISYSSGAPEYAPGFCLGSCWSIFILCVVCCLSIDFRRDRRDRDRMAGELSTTYATSVYHHYDVASSNHVHGEVDSIQHYVIKFVSDLRQVDGFLLQ